MCITVTDYRHTYGKNAVRLFKSPREQFRDYVRLFLKQKYFQCNDTLLTCKNVPDQTLSITKERTTCCCKKGGV